MSHEDIALVVFMVAMMFALYQDSERHELAGPYMQAVYKHQQSNVLPVKAF